MDDNKLKELGEHMCSLVERYGPDILIGLASAMVCTSAVHITQARDERVEVTVKQCTELTLKPVLPGDKYYAYFHTNQTVNDIMDSYEESLVCLEWD